MTDIAPQLIGLFGDRLKEREPLAKYTNFRLGGPARWFVDAKTVEEIQQAVGIAEKAGVEWFVLGGGSNTLVSDEGFQGLVIRVVMRHHVIGGTTIVAEAGVISAALARATAEAGLAGFTWAISLPGTIGGAVRGNAGCFGGEMRDVVKSVQVLRCIPPLPESPPLAGSRPEAGGGQGGVGACDMIELSNKDLKFGYRESAIKHSNDIVLSVTLELKRGDVAALRRELEEKLSRRKATQPLYAGSAGCMFKNFEFKNEKDLEKLKKEVDIPSEMLRAKRLSCGWLIDQMDLKGKKIGGAEISPEHGNFVINVGGATADDVVQLAAYVKTQASNRFGIQLQEEVQYLGF